MGRDSEAWERWVWTRDKCAREKGLPNYTSLRNKKTYRDNFSVSLRTRRAYAAAIEKIRMDIIGPVQPFAVATTEVCTRQERENEVAIHWVSAYHVVPGNEEAGRFARAAAEGGEPDSAVPDEYRWDTSLLYIKRVATEARFRSTAQWIRHQILRSVGPGAPRSQVCSRI